MNNINNEYKTSPYLNQSGMKQILISPAHYKCWLEQQSEPEEPERELRIGLATHALSLEPHTFDSGFAVAPVCDRRTKEGKLIWADFLESSPGKLALTAEEFAIAQSCSDSVRRNTWFKKAMEDPNVLIEKPLFHKVDEKDNLFRNGIKGRADLISPSNNFILDIKTHGGNLDKFDITKSINRNKYYLQELVYTILANENKIPVNDFIFVFVEKKEPFSSVSVGIDNPFMSKNAIDDLTRALETFNKCIETDTWNDLSETSILI